MDVIERFLRYVKVDTESDETSTTSPSTFKQFDLAHILVEELKEIGVDEVKLSDECLIYAKLNANTDIKCDHIGFVAHMDTSPDMSGKNVNPRIIEKYDGKAIVLNEELNIVMDPEFFPCLKKDIGSDLIVTDGTTLLGADDKAGVAEIMAMLNYLVKHPEIKHGDISVCFTPDEEVGRGTDNFNPEEFKVDYAYTVDGGDVEDIEFENFNASSATVHIQGLSIHPGSAKNRMINSLLVGFEFNSLLPVFDNPAYTEGYEGFNHLVSMEGDCEKSTMHYIIRNHDLNLLRKQEADFRNAMEFLNKKYGENTITIDFEDSYANMRSYIEKRMDIIDNVKVKMAKLGVTAKSSAIRGGTDGARLTYMGIMCPNLGTGGRNYHGKYEYASINEMKFMAKLLVEIVKVN